MSTTGAYNKRSRNCEHFATLITTGIPSSMTIERVKLIFLGVGLAVVGGLRPTRKLLAQWNYKPGMTPNQIANIHKKHLAGLSHWQRWMGVHALFVAHTEAVRRAKKGSTWKTR